MEPGDGQGSAAGQLADERTVGGRLVAVDGRMLPLRSVALSAVARGGLTRVVLKQRFVNPYAEPLRVGYLVPLPSDGALAGYAFRIGERRIAGEVDRIEAARERFETALLEGRSAAMVEQDRANLFTLEIGNVPAGVEVEAELTIDQPLAWLDEGAWEWRFPTVVAPRYLGAEGRVGDADRVSVDVAESGVPVDAEVTLTVRDALPDGEVPLSPSHQIAVAPGALGLEVKLAKPVALDRDVVIRWPAAGMATGLTLDTARPAAGCPHAGAAYGLLTVMPPSPKSRPPIRPRDLIVLIDTSGSMADQPLAQAQAIACALVESLTEVDQLELIEFSNRPRRWLPHAVRITAATRQDAIAWLTGLGAGGGTEMRDAVVEALRPLRSAAQRQAVLITDGLIGFENEIVATVARELPIGSRLHTVGVGSSVNRALTSTAARAGRGTEVVIGLDEDVRPYVARLLARMRAPIVTDLKLSGSALLDHAPAALPDVYAGAPLRVALKLRPEGGNFHVHGQTPTGSWNSDVTVPAMVAGEGNAAVVALYGREAVEDLELQRAAGVETVDHDVERIGLEFEIATRLTSWVAVSEEPAVDPRQPVRRERIPHALPQGLSIEGLGLHDPRGAFTKDRAIVLGAFTGATRLVRPAQSTLTQRLGLHAPSRGSKLPVARLVVRKGRELTFEISVELPLFWDPEEAKVFWADRTIVRAEIVAERTTSAGAIASGLTVRLGLRLVADGPAGLPERVGVKIRNGWLMLRVLRA
jgi:Ca-activated chloride channel homolog